MHIKILKLKEYRSRSGALIDQHPPLKAPPYNRYGSFQPGAFSRLYHQCEPARMKNSHYWLKTLSEAKNDSKLSVANKIQKEFPAVQNGILNGEIRAHENLIAKCESKIIQKVENGILKVEIGEEDNQEVVYID